MSVCLAFHCSAQATPHTGAALIAAPWPAADAPVDEAAAAQFETLQARGGLGGGTGGLQLAFKRTGAWGQRKPCKRCAAVCNVRKKSMLLAH